MTLDVYTQGGELAKTRHTEQDCEDGAKLGTERDEGAPGQKRLFLRSERGIASCRDDGESELPPRVNGKAPCCSSYEEDHSYEKVSTFFQPRGSTVNYPITN
jgi:hypothetical protein